MIIDSPIISGSYLSTGSLSQTGNVSITGSLTATGGISGSFSGSGANLFDIPAAGIVGLNLSQIASGSVSASISPNQGLLINTSVSASNFTGSFTGSLTGIATSASYASFALTSSYSLGGSGFPFSGSAVITGSLIVSGSGLTITGSVAISTLTTGSGVRYVIADQNGLVSAQTASAVIFTTQQTIATAGQTVFPITNGYSTGYVTVFVNGSKLNDDEFTDTSGTNIVFATGSMVNDVVEFQKYLPASGVSNNTLRTTNYFTTTLGQTNFTVNYTPGLLDVFYNGSKLSNAEYTAANGTSILLATGSNAGDTLEVDVYSYQVGAFSGIGGVGVANQIAYYNTTNSITGSNAFTVSGSAIIITGSLIVSGSGTFTNIGPAVFSGSVTAVGGFSGSFSGNADSASLAQNSLLLQGTGSVGFTTTASFLAVSSSQQQISASQQQLSSSFLTLTASYTALSSSYTSLSASYDTFSGSASTRITANSSSIQQVSSSQQQISASLLNVISIFATTGSNSFRATQSITGSLTVTGQIIAQSINVQQVTSSIIYSSGSNVFGCDLNSRQTFTGSVNITGSVTIASAATYALDVTGTGRFTAPSSVQENIVVKSANTGYSKITIDAVASASAQLAFLENGSQKGVVGYRPSTGNVFLSNATGDILTIASTGAATFACQVCVPNIISTGASGGRYGTFNAPTNGGYITFEAGGTPFGDLGSYCAQIGTCDATTLLLGSRTGYALALGSNSTERLRISVGGLLLLNGASSRTTGYTTNPAGHYAAELTNYGGAQYFTNNTNAEGSYLVLGKSKGSSVNSNTAVVNSDALGALLYHGTDGTAAKEAAAIYGHVDGNVTTGCIPGRLSFWTSYNGVLTERMRISSTGVACFACELTAKTLGTNDLLLNNLNYECANYVDGTRGSWLIQEGACDLFIINQVSCKKYKFNLIEIK